MDQSLKMGGLVVSLDSVFREGNGIHMNRLQGTRTHFYS